MTSFTQPGFATALNGPKAFFSLVKRELTLSFRTPGHIVNPLGLFFDGCLFVSFGHYP